MTSDGSSLLLREIDQPINLADSMSQALCSPRDPTKVRDAQEELLRARLFAIAMGYEDCNDHDTLRFDSGLKTAIGRQPETGEALASQPTLSRLENRASKAELRRLSDALVQAYLEKAIAHPTDARLYHKARVLLVKAAKDRGIALRQSYLRLGKRALIMSGRYAHARQMKRAKREQKKLKNFLGRVYRDILRNCPEPDESLKELPHLAKRLLGQKRHDKNKIYSLHAPEVECIAKGKAHKKYEFGCKVSVVTTSRDKWTVGVEALHHNPFDGHTLKGALQQVSRIVG